MKYLLDTDHITALQRGEGADFEAISAKMAAVAPDDIALSVVSLHEQTVGCHALINRAKSDADMVRGYALLGRVLDVFAAAPVLPFDDATAAKFREVGGRGLRIGVLDQRIAAIAMSRHLTLVTRNTRHFGRIAGLVTEDWTI